MTKATATIVGDQKFESADGLNIVFQSWRPADKARGVVVIVPGFNSQSGYCTWAAEQFVARELAVYALDLRGRVSDVASFVTLAKSREAGRPVFLLGQGAGGVVACLYAIEHQAQLAGLICESLAQQVPAPDFPLIRLPVLILSGTLDTATRPSGSQLFYDTAGSRDKTLKLYDGPSHDLLNAVDKDWVMADVERWIEAHMTARKF
jgi:alpha-beta hydrolase superfamily lysophospholipase